MRRITYDQIIELVALNPQRIFNLHPDVETYTLVDTHAQYVIERANLYTQCGWSPFEGMRVSGRVVGVWIRGVKVYDGENILVKAGFGRDIASTRCERLMRSNVLFFYRLLYERFARALIFQNSAEDAHQRMLRLLLWLDDHKWAHFVLKWAHDLAFVEHPLEVGGVRLLHPLILAAGFVKGEGFCR